MGDRQKDYKLQWLFINLVILLFLFSCEEELKPINFNSFNADMSLNVKNLDGYDLAERMNHYDVPGVSIAVMKNGQIAWAKGYGITHNNGKKVDTTTLFQAASISKPISAIAILQLFEQGKVDLNENVNNYLQGYQIEDNQFTTEKKVTLEKLLTHTAGVTVHGFPGYKQNEKLPKIEEILNGKGNTNKIEVYTVPGSEWKYSGGGYLIVQKAVEDVAAMSLKNYMERNVFSKIDMTNSTFEQPLSKIHSLKASAGHERAGDIVSGLWNNYPELAAAGLWTTPSDLAKYCIEIHEILSGKKQGILRKETVELMLTKHEMNWGLGPRLDKEGDSLIFDHNGGNKGFSSHMISFAHLGNGLIIMTNGDRCEELISEIQKSIFDAYQW